MRKRASIAWALGLAMLATLVLGGCGCDGDVAVDPDLVVVTFTGELVAEDGARFVFEAGDGTRREVVVTGRSWALKRGRPYAVRAIESGGVLRTGLGHRCGVDGIRNADGSAIDTSYWGWVEGKLITFVLYAGGGLVAIVALWAAARYSRHWLYDR